jgi:glyoxylase-like metal-dependent hydrolase (beta-lactamase superfamily II)
MDVHLPPGVAGPDAIDFDVRCFLVPHRDGLVLVDTLLPESDAVIGEGLRRAGADWGDITDVVVTHGHLDHAGGLAGVLTRAPQAAVWAGSGDRAALGYEGTVGSLLEGELVRNLRVLETPGHTPGHCCLVLQDDSVLFAGDLIGSMAGELTRGPAAFTADAVAADLSLRRVARLGAERVLFGHGPEVPRPSEALERFMDDAGGRS